MAQQTINIGTVANDGTGDPLRTAFDKANDNFTEVYAGLGVPDDSVTYAKLAPEFTDSIAQNDLSFGTETIHTGTVTGDSTFNILGVSQGVTKTAVFTGGTSLAFGGTVTSTYNVIAGEYDPALDNFIQVFATGTYPNQDFYITISQPV